MGLVVHRSEVITTGVVRRRINRCASSVRELQGPQKEVTIARTRLEVFGGQLPSTFEVVGRRWKQPAQVETPDKLSFAVNKHCLTPRYCFGYH